MQNKFKSLLLILLCAGMASCGGPAQETTSSSTSEEQTITASSSSSATGTQHNVDLDLPTNPSFDEPAVMFHYWRKDGIYTNWDMWLWEANHDGAAYAFNYKDDWGVIAAYPLSTWDDPITNTLGFIIRKGGNSWSAKDCGGNDLYLDFSLFDKDENDVYHVYMISGDSNMYTDSEGTIKGKITMATFATESRIALRCNVPVSSYILRKDGELLIENNKVGNITAPDIDLPNGEKVDYLSKYEIFITLQTGDELSAVISKTLLFGSDAFGEQFNYDGELGAIYTNESTTFKVWSPLSSKIKLRIYDTGTPASMGGSDVYSEYEMVKGEKGVFAKEVEGDLEGKYYTFVVTNTDYTDKETIDPYAKSCGINGIRGMVVDFSKTNPNNWDEVSPLAIDKKALTVYETHVADVTSSTTWIGTEANRKLFKGMYESGTTYTENGKTVATGFDHIKELGVNAVQIIPLFDQANNEASMTFNWGYNPSNYNCVEGGYSSNPYDGYVRIKEFKELVQAYHDEGMNIIMDVVYNHMNGAVNSNFDIIMPGYYFRYTNSLALSNGSGCGNETASEHYMFRKFMIDSASFWAKEYKLGGFRFDLMGLHDLTTMEQLTAAAKEINPNITIYGEPWTGGTTTLSESASAKQINGNSYKGYGAFNDQFRDAMIKGGLNAATDLGWITNRKTSLSASDMSKLTRGIKGITAAAVEIADPDKTVNYVTCHDNYTLHDRAIMTKQFTDTDDAETLAKMNVLANSVVFTSQGISFMLAGEEFLRTKVDYDSKGEPFLSGNSYNASYETNELDYSLKVAHQDMVESYKKMIALKQDVDGLHLDKDGIKSLNVYASTDNGAISYKINDTTNNREYYIIHANGLGTAATFDLSGYNLYWSTVNGLNKELTSITALDKYETIVVYKAYK